MNRAAMALALLAVVLAGLVLAELLLPIGADEGDAAGPPSPQTDAAMASGPNSATGMVAAILGRPLFRTDRKPAPGDTRGMASGAPADLPRLTAILMTAEEKRAIFQPVGKERPIVVVEGETVGNWRVQQIAVDAVTLTGPGGTRRIEPKFSGGAATGASSAMPFAPAPSPAISGPGGQANGGPDRMQGKH